MSVKENPDRKKTKQNKKTLSIYFYLKVHKLDDSFTFIWKEILYYIFLCYILSFGSFGLNCEFIRRDYGFSINSKKPFMSSGDKRISNLKISVTNIDRFRCFADFDIKHVLLGRNSFERIPLC